MNSFRILVWMVLVVMVIVAFPFALAQEDHSDEIEEGRLLVEAEVSCDSLSDEQLEAVGEYTMERMHPGQAHDVMHQMMGLQEGTLEHDLFHINLARAMYCGQTSGVISYGGMMGRGGMMGAYQNEQYQRAPSSALGWGGGMMSWLFPIGFWGMGIGMIFVVLFWIAVIWLVVWLVRKYGRGLAKKESPLSILKKRYAKGELSKREYEQMRRELEE